VRCLLPHASPLTSQYVTALHQGGALNAFQLHLLTSHGTHSYACQSSHRDRRCRICRGELSNTGKASPVCSCGPSGIN
jgi:hypothetical protein